MMDQINENDVVMTEMFSRMRNRRNNILYKKIYLNKTFGNSEEINAIDK